MINSQLHTLHSLQALDTTLFIDIGIYTHLATPVCYNEGSQWIYDVLINYDHQE